MSSLYTVTINLPDHKLGDQWVGISAIGPVPTSGITQGTLSRIQMWFKGPGDTGGTLFKLDSTAGGDGTIVLDTTTANSWEAHISPVSTFLAQAGDWKWTMKFYHSGNVSPITLYQGTLTVHDTTNP